MKDAVAPIHHAVAAALADLAPVTRYWVAYSGGRDSTVLLHAALATTRDKIPLAAVHIHHGLYPQADAWAAHCAQVCGALGIPLTLQHVDATPQPDESPEAAARRARYAACAQIIGHDEVLLTAHHQDDQAETVLLQLLRGSGPQGLAGMAACASWASGRLVRPLLTVSRAAIASYAAQQQLTWIEDPSNGDPRYARNYLRHHVLPLLAGLQPAVASTLCRAAQHAAQASMLLDELADADMPDSSPTKLFIPALLALTPARRHNVLRRWLKKHAWPMPQTRHLAQLERDVLQARADATPCLRWPGVWVRRYREYLYISAPDAPPSAPIMWLDPNLPVALPHNGVLQGQPVVGQGVALQHWQKSPITIRYRQGGERIQPIGSPYTRALKTLFQEHGIPPWQRARWPLLYIGAELVAVPQLVIGAPWAASAGEEGRVVEWIEM